MVATMRTAAPPSLESEGQASLCASASGSQDLTAPCAGRNGSNGEVMRLRVSIGGSFTQKEDGSWKYAGGETFLESVPTSWRYADLVFSLAEKVDGAISLKYQLPGEDLDPDALISVADDSDIAELFDEYFRALKLPGTPVKTFRLRLFLFRAAEVPYTPEDLEAEARYLEMLPLAGMGPSPSGGIAAGAGVVAPSVLDSDASSTRGDDLADDGMRTPSTVADAELAWEAGFKAGQEAAIAATEEQWSELLSQRVAELAQTAADHMWGGGESPPPSLPAPGVPPASPVSAGRASPALPVSVQMGEASMDPSNDPEFQSMFESKYERSAATSVATAAGAAAKRAGNGSGVAAGASGSGLAPEAVAAAVAEARARAAAGGAADLAAALPEGILPSPATRLPTHISIFGDDLEPERAAATVARFGPPPAAAAALPSHISEFGGSDDGDAAGEEAAAEADAVAVAYAALPAEDLVPDRSTSRRTGPGAGGLLPPEPALLPTRFDLIDTSAAVAAAAGAPGAGVGEGGLPQAPPSLHPPPPSSVLSSVHHIDSGQLTVLAKIGEGSFGEVSLCQCPTFGRVAVKWIKSTKVERWASFWREAELMSRLNHPNVLRFFGLVTQGEFVVGIMTEFAANGSLASFMRRRREGGGDGAAGGGAAFLPLRRRAHLALHAANGMAYLHSQKIVHFDVKPDNLLVDGDWGIAGGSGSGSVDGGPVLKVADFGLSVVKANTFCSDVHDLRGTLPYMAPEMVTDPRHVSEAADVWSLGVVFWELLTQQQPYADVAPAQLLGALGSGTARLPIPEWCEPEWRAVMEACWVEDPALRPTCRQLAMQLARVRDNAPPG